jgi:tetrahydromethanopterin S-methyltransferase subunit G
MTATALDQIEAKVRTMRDALVELNKRLDRLEARLDEQHGEEEGDRA